MNVVYSFRYMLLEKNMNKFDLNWDMEKYLPHDSKRKKAVVEQTIWHVHLKRRFWKIRAAVSLRLHKPMTTCRDTVADWRLFCRVPFAFSKLTWSTSVKKSIAPPPGKFSIASALSFYVIKYNRSCPWRASFPSRKSGVFCCHFFGDDPVVCRCRSPPPFDSPVNHPWIEMEVHNEEN